MFQNVPKLRPFQELLSSIPNFPSSARVPVPIQSQLLSPRQWDMSPTQMNSVALLDAGPAKHGMRIVPGYQVTSGYQPQLQLASSIIFPMSKYVLWLLEIIH